MRRSLLPVLIGGIALLAACSRVQPVVIPPPALRSSSASVQPEPPEALVLDVPFSSQAPHGNWDDPYQEACEEMSLIMAHYYLKGLTLTPEAADREILDMVAWETAHGYGQDVTTAQIGEIASDYYGYDFEVRDDVTVEAIKAELQAGNPVIIPAAGRMLGNPYFSGEGPFYHMLVIIGYDRTHFITHDPGTKRGARYRYTFDHLLDSIHDWTGMKEETAQGARRMLVIRP